MKFFVFFRYIISFICSILLISGPAYAGANVAVKGEGDEVPSYVRSNITGFDFHGEDLHLSSIAGAVARDADFSDGKGQKENFAYTNQFIRNNKNLLFPL